MTSCCTTSCCAASAFAAALPTAVQPRPSLLLLLPLVSLQLVLSVLICATAEPRNPPGYLAAAAVSPAATS
jgi:hypothetical protein